MTQTVLPRKTKFVRISDDVRRVLCSRVEYEGNNLRITGPRLDPKTYKALDAILSQLGGKWTSGKVQAHAFAEPPRSIIEDALRAGRVLNKKQSFQFFETPDNIAERMVQLARISERMTVLEPSAGRGAIIRAINRLQPKAAVTAIDIDPSHEAAWETLEISAKYVGDFLCETQHTLFDRVLMNPPFSAGQDADHIMHAFGFLKPGGWLVSICGQGIRAATTAKAMKFAEFVQEHIVNEEQLESGAFRDSGTMVPSSIIVLQSAL